MRAISPASSGRAGRTYPTATKGQRRGGRMGRLGPVVRHRGWSRWFTLAVAAAFAAAFEPMRETVNFGQVNMLLLALVAGDLLLLVRGGRRWAGVLIGLATAIKLTPGLFILYLLLTRRYRAAVT